MVAGVVRGAPAAFVREAPLCTAILQAVRGIFEQIRTALQFVRHVFVACFIKAKSSVTWLFFRTLSCIHPKLAEKAERVSLYLLLLWQGFREERREAQTGQRIAALELQNQDQAALIARLGEETRAAVEEREAAQHQAGALMIEADALRRQLAHYEGWFRDGQEARQFAEGQVPLLQRQLVALRAQVEALRAQVRVREGGGNIRKKGGQEGDIAELQELLPPDLSAVLLRVVESDENAFEN